MTVQPLGGAVAKSLFLWPVTHRERFQSEGAFASVVELLRNNGGKRSLSLATARLLGKEVPGTDGSRELSVHGISGGGRKKNRLKKV